MDNYFALRSQFIGQDFVFDLLCCMDIFNLIVSLMTRVQRVDLLHGEHCPLEWTFAGDCWRDFAARGKSGVKHDKVTELLEGCLIFFQK